jgi:F-type H+-transporting ATPase subunit epsilon
MTAAATKIIALARTAGEATTAARATSTDGLVVKVEVLTPEGQVFADEVELVSTRITTGSIGIKARHAPLMAILEPTELRLYKSDSEVVRFPHTVTASSTHTLRTPASPRPSMSAGRTRHIAYSELDARGMARRRTPSARIPARRERARTTSAERSPPPRSQRGCCGRASRNP